MSPMSVWDMEKYQELKCFASQIQNHLKEYKNRFVTAVKGQNET